MTRQTRTFLLGVGWGEPGRAAASIVDDEEKRIFERSLKLSLHVLVILALHDGIAGLYDMYTRVGV